MGGEIHDLFRRGGPDRARQGREVEVAEIAPGAQPVEKLRDGHRRVTRHGQRVLVEMQNVPQHPQERRAEHITFLGKDRVEIGQRIFQPPAVDRRAKAHVRGHNRHVQFRKERGKMRVVGIVEHDEPGIDRLIAILARDHRPRMAADLGPRLIEGDAVRRCQHMRRPHAGNPAANHGDTPPKRLWREGTVVQSFERHRRPALVRNFGYGAPTGKGELKLQRPIDFLGRMHAAPRPRAKPLEGTRTAGCRAPLARG